MPICGWVAFAERDLTGVRPVATFSIVGFWPYEIWGGDLDLLGPPYKEKIGNKLTCQSMFGMELKPYLTLPLVRVHWWHRSWR